VLPSATSMQARSDLDSRRSSRKSLKAMRGSAERTRINFRCGLSTTVIDSLRMPEQRTASIRFGPFELNPETQELRKHGLPVKLSGQAIQVLLVLTACPGKLVTREELQQKLWRGDSFGDFEHGLNAAVNKLREKLGDSAITPTYVETLPGRGYRFVAPLTAAPDLRKQVNGILPSAPLAYAPSEHLPVRPKHRAWKRKAAIAIAACVVVTGFLSPWIGPRLDELLRLYQLQQLTVVPLTSLPGSLWAPTFSPDGSQLAFVWNGGNLGAGGDLYVKVIGSDRLLRLTSGGRESAAAWSPDGQSIAFWHYSPSGCGVFLVSPLGGPERKIASTGCSIPGQWISWNPETEQWINWSPDGRRLAFLDYPVAQSLTTALFVISLDSMEKARVNTGCSSARTPAFSPRGDSLAWSCTEGLSGGSIRLQRLSDGSVTQVLRGIEGEIVSELAWSRDSRRIVFSSGGDLWEVVLARPGHAEKLPVVHDVLDFAVNTSRSRLAFVQERLNINIWRVNLTNPAAPAREVVSSSRLQWAPNISPDGKQIAFESNRSGSHEVWICDADGSNAVQLSSFGIRYTGSPHWSPDGKLIAFDSRIGGEANIYLVDPHGGVPRKLAIDLHGNSFPRWSHDGNWIYFINGDDSGKPQVWKVPSDGGHAVPVAGPASSWPIESPDGQYVYFSRDFRLWRVGTDGTGEQQIQGMPRVAYWGEALSPFGSGIYFLQYTNNKPEIDFFDLSTQKIRRAFVPEKPVYPWIGGLPVSSDGKWLLFPQLDEMISDVMMIENWK